MCPPPALRCRACRGCPLHRPEPRHRAGVVRPRLHQGAQVAHDRTVSRRPHEGRRRRPEPAERVLHRRGERRRVEDHRLRPHVEADLRRAADRARSARSTSRLESERHLRRERARDCSAPTSRPATASTSRPTPARRGRTSVCATGSRFRRSPSIRAIPTALFVAVLGHPYGPNAERGIFRSTDGGRTFQKVLYKDENTGGVDVVLDPVEPEHRLRRRSGTRQGPWENGEFSGPGSGLFKSTDGGDDVEAARQRAADVRAGRPRPHRHRGRAEHAEPAVRVVEARRGARSVSLRRRRRELDRRDDRRRASPARVGRRRGRRSIRRIRTSSTPRTSRGSRPTAARRGRRFAARRAATTISGCWINPNDPNIILLVGDQGAIVTVNGGADVELVVQPADGGVLSRRRRQRVSVSRLQRPAGVRLGVRAQPRRRRHGSATASWHPVGVEEYGYVAPDPLDPDSSTAAR